MTNRQGKLIWWFYCVEISGVTLDRRDGKWQVADLAGKEQTNRDAIRSLLGKLTGLRIQSLLGIAAKPDYRQDAPVLEVMMTRQGGEVLSYRFSKPEDASYYVLKRSDQEHYFKVAEYTVNLVKETTRETLVQARIKDLSSEVPGDNYDEMDDAEDKADEEKGAGSSGKSAEDE